jgi:hypothetical protein
LDPTAETCAFGDLPAGDQDRWTLIINPRFLTEDKDPEQETPNGAAGDIQNELYRFQKSPSLDATSNLKRVHTHVKVKKDMSVSVRQELTVTGSFNMRLRSQLGHLKTAEEKSEFLHKALELDARAKVEDFKVSGLSELEGELKVELTWNCKEYLYAIGSQFVLELPLVKHPYAELLSEERRMYPAAIGKALTLEDKITVSTEAPFKIDIVPEEQTKNRGGGNSTPILQIQTQSRNASDDPFPDPKGHTGLHPASQRCRQNRFKPRHKTVHINARVLTAVSHRQSAISYKESLDESDDSLTDR